MYVRPHLPAWLLWPVLVGLWAMHGLGSVAPVDGPEVRTLTASHSGEASPHRAAPEHRLPHGTPAAPHHGHAHQPSGDPGVPKARHAHPPEGHPSGSPGHRDHLRHADPDCAAATLESAPPLPALAPARTAPLADRPGAGPKVAVADRGRSPPSLSALQLLRI
ncbi:DUF6153 family protein [Streptomyces sp. NPDC005438]|uniref:DUF6153 family protein n=1 Tax=Streptomyces sp. NPDC005438 TaxID=3156880 RepID=UPI0033AE370D